MKITVFFLMFNCRVIRAVRLRPIVTPMAQTWPVPVIRQVFCVYLCNHEIQRTCFHVTFKTGQGGRDVQGGDGVQSVPLFTQNPTG